MKKPHSYHLEEDLIDDIRKASEKAGLSASEFVGKVLRGALDSQREILKELDAIDLVDLIRKVKGTLKVKQK